MTDPLPVVVVGIKKYTFYSYDLSRENSVLLQIIIYIINNINVMHGSNAFSECFNFCS